MILINIILKDKSNCSGGVIVISLGTMIFDYVILITMLFLFLLINPLVPPLIHVLCHCY